MPFSVVIITKNEEKNLRRLLKGIQGLSDDIVIYDSYSQDNSIQVANQYGANFITGEWLGYGNSKNKANSIAKYDWILSLDADELPDAELLQQLKSVALTNPNEVYEVKRNIVWRNKILYNGIALSEKKIRLFHKSFVYWNDALVHESLVYNSIATKKTLLKGILFHYTYADKYAAYSSLDKYARLMAQQKQNKKSSAYFFSPYINAAVDWIKNTIFRLGFLDGWKGIEFCNLNAWYVYKKYTYLLALKNDKHTN